MDGGDPFTNVQSSTYWSSSTYVSSPAFAWRVNLADGYVDIDVKAYGHHVWPVRGGQ